MSSSVLCPVEKYNEIDPDIAGVGVRVSFYIQAFLLVFLVDRSWEDAPIALWTYIAMSFSLTIATIINQLQNAMTLLAALVVSNLVWLANVGIFIALASYSRQKANSRKAGPRHPIYDYNVKFGAMAQTLLSMVLTIYLWSNIDTFGCDSVEIGSNPRTKILYVFFVGAVPVLDKGRVAALTCSSIATSVYVLVSLRELLAFCKSRRKRGRGSPDVLGIPMHSPTSPPPSPSHARGASNTTLVPGQLEITPDSPRVSSSESSPRSPHSHHGGKTPRRPKRRRWSDDLDPMTIGVFICHIMIFIYFVVSCELLLYKNGSDSEDRDAVGFGQVVAMVAIIPSVLSTEQIPKADEENSYTSSSSSQSF
ncbi:hypothetical protein VNI00_002086 [Paramarasmius palmivorus]|uniref:Uncharacterized protein n=1 Tax=Paramarasmius palmivorus TaxID=297713 RepID=A0AAW0E6Y9_9AGAR